MTFIFDTTYYLIAGYCDIQTINNISETCKDCRDLRLQRLFYGYLIAKYFNGSIRLFIKNSSEISDRIKENDYKLSDYLYDIFSQISSEHYTKPNTYLSTFIDRDFISNYNSYICFKKPQKISYNFKSQLVNNGNKFNKDDLITYSELTCAHEIFRVPVAVYMSLRRKHLSVLALIY